MGIFDSLKKAMSAPDTAFDSREKTVGKGNNRSESFSFSALPKNTEELKVLPEAALTSPFAAVALTILALCRYEESPDDAFEMLNFLKGPEDLSTYEKQFIKERLSEKLYKPRSFFGGAVPENGYIPDVPYVISVSENPYSFDNENWATLYVKSGGADNPRPVKLRKKPSTGQWFLNEIQCLSDIRIPVSEDPWA